jgi:hypothetical protein
MFVTWQCLSASKNLPALWLTWKHLLQGENPNKVVSLLSSPFFLSQLLILALSKHSMFWHFSPESGDINLGKIPILCCLNCISEYINGFSVLKNPWGTQIIQT